MAERGVLFSGPMVRSLLAGTKTQTRRGIVMPSRRGHSEFGRSDTTGYDWHFRDKGLRWHDVKHDRLLELLQHRVGDRLYVRETWTHTGTGVWQIADVWNARDGRVVYQADEGIPGAKYWPSIHMPRAFSRLTLNVTDVRIERLQECSAGDAIAEGIQGNAFEGWRDYSDGEKQCDFMVDPRQSYRTLWNSINGPGAWDANPWVAAYTFTVHQGNIDAPA